MAPTFKMPAAWLARLGVIAALACFLPAPAYANSLTLSGTIRDFNSWNTVSGNVPGQVDFENPCCGDDHGIVQATLGADGKPVFSGGAHWSVNSAASFYQWYHDDPAVNRTGTTTITLAPNSATTYQFSSDSFFPIDGLLLAQQACCGHNYGFTTEFHTLFTFKSANNDTFGFTGDDDVFVFINNRLAIDLGGVHGAEGASVNLNDIAAAFGLADGSTYDLDVFQAERHTVGSNFTMTTSLQLTTAPDPSGVPEPATLSLLGLGLLGFAFARRR